MTYFSQSSPLSAAAALQLSNQWLQDILAATPDPVTVIDARGYIHYANAAFYKLVGPGPAGRAQQFSAYQTGEGRITLEKFALPQAIAQNIWSGETSLQDQYGQVIPVNQVVLPLRNDQGELQAFAIISRDLRAWQQVTADFQALEQHVSRRTTALQQLTQRQRALTEVIRKIHSSLDLDTLFKLAATEVRQLLAADRVGIFRFYPDSGYDDGEFVSEDVLSDYQSVLFHRIHDHCFGEQFAAHYAQGRIQVVADIEAAGLTDCHIEVLSKFQIRANLVVPLLQHGELWGLLCIHQCDRPRQWHAAEVEFVRQIATQLGVALQQAELLHQAQTRNRHLQRLAEQQQALTQVISKIRSSLDLDTIFQTAAAEVQQLLGSDRVGIFRFLPDSGYDDGEFVAEAVRPGLASVLQLRVHDHCFGDQFAVHYAAGRVQAVADITQAGLADCHVQVLAQFQIRANLVVPLLKGEDLWGLLCIHQCAQPRTWEPNEIEFVQQIATQLSVALQQAELLHQTRQHGQQLQQMLHELQRTQTHLIQSEKMSSLGQLVAGVAHEINNPVNFIYGNLGHVANYMTDLLAALKLYQDKNSPPDADLQAQLEALDIEFVVTDLPKMLTSMRMGTERIREIVLSLRNFSRLDQAEVKAVDLHEGIDSTLLILQHRLKPSSQHPGIKIVKQYGALPKVECFASQLNQVFMNLLANAIDALHDVESPPPTASPHCITIQTQVVNTHWVQVVIADNGPGIPETVRDRLFDPFFTTKPSGKGTGLGLSISYQIVEKHNGRLWCESLPEQGARFVMEIPVSGATIASPPSVSPLPCAS